MTIKKSIPLFVFLSTIIFYVYTLLPSLAWGDGTKLQSEAVAGESFVLAEMPSKEFSPDPYPFAKVGVAAWDHPLYIIVGHLLVRMLPFIDSLWLVNLISAVCGAASVAIVYALSFRFTNSSLASLYASFSLAVSHTFWWHSSTPEVYTLLIVLLLISFSLFDRYERTGQESVLFCSAFFLGLAASTHVLAFLAIPALVFYSLLSQGFHAFRVFDFRKLTLPMLGFLIGFSIYLIQFVRMSRNIPFDEIMGPVVGSTFLSQLVTLSPILLGESLLSYLFFLTVQFGPVGLTMGGVGLRTVLNSQDLRVRKIVSFFIVFTLFGIFYRVTDQFTFFITAYVFWAMLMGIGSAYVLGLIPEKRRSLFTVLLWLLLLATPFLYMTLPSLAARYGVNDDSLGIPKIGVGLRDGLAYYINPNKRGDYSAYEFGSQTISGLAPKAVVIAEWYTDTDEYFILRYFTKVKKVRPDVTVLGWPTQDPFSFDSQLVLDLINDSFPEHPIYLASLSDRFYASSKLVGKYCMIPEDNLYRLYQKANDNRQCLDSDSITE